MADKLGILINAILNVKQEDLQKQLDSVAKKIKINLKPRIDFDENVIAKFKSDVDKLAKNIKLNLRFDVDKQSVKDAEKTITETAKKISEKSKSQNKIKIFDKEQLEAEGRQFFISTTGIVNRVKKQFKDLGDVNVNFLKNAKNQIVGFEAEIKKLDGTIERLRFNLAKIKVGDSTQEGFVFSGANLIDKNAGDVLQKNLNTLQKFETRLKNIRDSFTSSRGVKDVTNLNILNKEYNSILSTIEKLRKSQSNLTEEQKRNIDKQINNLRSLYKAYRDIEITAEKGFNFKQFENITGQVIKLRENLNATVVTLKNYKDALSTPLLQGYRITGLSGVQETEEYLKLTQKLQKGNEFVDLTAYIDKATGSIYKYSHASRNAMIDTLTWSKAIQTAWKRMAQWFAGGTLFFGALRQIKEAISYITELDNSLNEIRIVTNKTQQEVNNLALSYNKLAKEMNVTTKEVVSTAADLFRQGLDEGQVEERMKAIIQYAKISSISLAESNKIITATANATGESVQKIIDVFAYLGDMTASGAEEIGEALQKVASTAENSGVSLEKAASWIATISSITRESASVIGNSLKSIISRYEQIKAKGFNEEDATQINDVTKALEAVGITAVDAQGQLRPIAEVLDELGAKWDGLTRNEKAYVATALAGTYQRNRLITLLDNYSVSLKNYEIALNSAGIAEEKFAIYQESTQAKLDKFRATLESLYQNTLNSGFIKFVLDLGTGIVGLIDKIGLLNTAISGLIIYFTFFKTSSLFLPFINAATIAIGKLTAGLNLSAAAAIKLNKALGMLAPVAVFFAIQGLIKLFDSLIVTIDEQKEKVAVAKQEYESITSELSKLNEELKITNDRINELNSKDKLTLIEENELSKLELTNEELRKRIALLEKEQEIKEKELAREAQKLYEKQFGKYDFSQQQIDEYINRAKITGNNAILLAEEKNVSALIAAYKQFLDLKKEALSSGNLKDVEHFDDLLTGIEKKLINNAKELQNIKDILGSLKNPTEQQKQILNEIEQALNSINGIIISDKINEINENIEKNSESLQKYADNLKQLDDAIKSFQDVTDKIQSLYKIQNELNKSGKITADIMDEIISKHSELIGYLGDREALENKISEAIRNQEKVQAQALKNMLENSQTYFNEQIRGNTELFNKLRIAYGKDAENFKTLAEAKDATDRFLVRAIGQRWSQMYGSQEEALRAVIARAERAIKTIYLLNPRDPVQIQLAEKYAQDIKTARAQLAALQSIRAQMERTVKSINLKSINLSSISLPTSSSKSSSSKSPSSSSAIKTAQEVYKPVIDRYYEINNLIEQINQKLERNSLLLEQVNNPSKIKHLRERINLYKQLTSAYETLNKEQEKEREEIRQLLRNRGFVFDALGNIVNYATQLKKFTGDTAKNIEELIDRYGELNKKIADTSNQILSNQNQIRQHIETIKQTMYEIVDSAMSPYEKLVTIQRNNISLLGEIDTEEEARKHVEYLKSISKAYEQQMSAIESSILKAKQELASLKDSSMIESVNALISYLEDKKIKLQIDYIANQDAIYNAEKRANETKLDVIKKVESKIIDMIRKRYEEERDLINKNHELQIRRLKEQKQAYEEIINQKLKELELIEDQESYEKQLIELLEERANLQRQHDILLMDSSLESAVQREELLEQLSQKDKEIAELQHKRSLELRKRNLRDALEKHNKEIDDKINKYEEENKKYNEMINERLKIDNLYVEARKALESGFFRDIEGHLVNLTDALIAYENQWGEGLSILGDTIKSELIDNLKEAQNALLQLSDLLRDINNREGYIPKLPDLSNVNNTPKEVQDLLENIKQTPSQQTPPPPPTPPPQKNVPNVSAITRTLKRGSRGDDVLILQKALNQILGVGLAEDGIFGPKTEEAVRLFQQRQNIRVDGIVGPETKAQLERLLGGSPPPQQNVPKVSTIAQTLKRGSRGNDVLTLQKALNQILGVGLAEDGIFGSKTEAAVRLFQQRQKIRVDGIVGPETKAQFKILGYSEGGLVDYTGLAFVHGTKQKPEAFLDNEDRLLIANLTEALKLNSTKFLPKFNLKPIIPSLAGVGNVSIQLGNLINIEGNADSNVIPRLKQEGQNILENLKKELSKRGVTFRVR